ARPAHRSDAPRRRRHRPIHIRQVARRGHPGNLTVGARMPRLRQVPRSEVHDELTLKMYDQLFGEKDPVAMPGTATGTPGDWWTAVALVPDVMRHPRRSLTRHQG